MLTVCRHITCSTFESTCAARKTLKVPLELPLGDEGTPESANRHVRQRQEPVEADSESPTELGLVGTFQLGLRRGKHRTLWIEDEVEGEIGVFAPVTEVVEPPQSRDARVEDSLATLSVDILAKIAGQ